MCIELLAGIGRYQSDIDLTLIRQRQSLNRYSKRTCDMPTETVCYKIQLKWHKQQILCFLTKEKPFKFDSVIDLKQTFSTIH